MAFDGLDNNSDIRPDIRDALWPGLNWLLLPEKPASPWFAQAGRGPVVVAPPKHKAAFEKSKAAGPPEQAKGRRETESAWRPVPGHLWPSPWRERLAGTRAGRVVWTYWDLGQDMCHTPDAQRREFFQRVIADLAHPAGTHTFFPVCLPENVAESPSPAFTPNPEIFWSALQRLGARGVLALGDKTVKALAMEEQLCLWGMARRHGFFVWELPDVDRLTSDEKLYAVLLEFLRNGLRDMTRGLA